VGPENNASAWKLAIAGPPQLIAIDCPQAIAAHIKKGMNVFFMT
jgi:hypothetical protein